MVFTNSTIDQKTKTKQAKAVRISTGFGIEKLTIDNVDVAAPHDDEVLVEIKAVSLNYRDLMTVNGNYDPRLAQPRIICSDGAGEVLSVGAAVSKFKPGDRVAGTFFQNWNSGRFSKVASKSALGGSIDGVLTNERTFNQNGLVHIPQHLSFEEAATLPCAALTAWHGLVPTAHLSSADTVLLLGTGGVSIFGLQFAKMHGARVIITSGSDEKLERAKKLGADETINYKQYPEWQKEVQRLTEGEGADVVLEVGGAGTLGRSLKSVRDQGQVSLIGVLSGIAENLNIGPILHGNVRVQGIYVGSREMFESMNKALSLHKLKPVVDKTFELEQIADALRCMENGQHFGKIVVRL